MTDFINLTSNADVDELLASDEPVWIFKHSTACGTSFHAHEEVSAFAATHPDARIGMVVVQTARPVSNYIAERLGKMHASPQLFLVRDGAIAWHGTHYSITAEAMAKASETSNA